MLRFFFLRGGGGYGGLGFRTEGLYVVLWGLGLDDFGRRYVLKALSNPTDLKPKSCRKGHL